MISKYSTKAHYIMPGILEIMWEIKHKNTLLYVILITIIYILLVY